MSHQARGARAERKVAKLLRGEGWIVKGTGDSHGAIDLIAVRAGVTMLVQVKGSSRQRGAYADFQPAERAEFLAEAEAAGADLVSVYSFGNFPSIQAWLVWDPADRNGPRWIHPSKWPELPTALRASVTGP